MKYASLALLGGFDMVVGSDEAEDVVDAEVTVEAASFSYIVLMARSTSCHLSAGSFPISSKLERLGFSAFTLASK
jgi:hypothetical protein